MAEIQKYITPLEASVIAGVPLNCADRWCRRYPGLAVKVGGRWRVNPEALDRMMRGLSPQENAA